MKTDSFSKTGHKLEDVTMGSVIFVNGNKVKKSCGIWGTKIEVIPFAGGQFQDKLSYWLEKDTLVSFE